MEVTELALATCRIVNIGLSCATAECGYACASMLAVVKEVASAGWPGPKSSDVCAHLADDDICEVSTLQYRGTVANFIFRQPRIDKADIKQARVLACMYKDLSGLQLCS